MSTELQSVNHWLVENKLCLHPGKCEAMLFSSKRKRRRSQNFCVKFGSTDIHGTNEVKYLGSIIERDLSGTECVKSIINKANGRLKFLYRHKHVLSRELRKILSLALIQSQMDYACMSWYYHLTKDLQQKLQIVQNKMIRFILDKSNYDHIGRDEFLQINFMNVQNRVKQLSLNIVHKIFYKKTPDYLRPFFVRVNEIHKYNTRGCRFNFQLPTSSNNTTVSKSFSYNATKAWNALSNEIKSKSNYNSFKFSLKYSIVHNEAENGL